MGGSNLSSSHFKKAGCPFNPFVGLSGRNKSPHRTNVILSGAKDLRLAARNPAQTRVPILVDVLVLVDKDGRIKSHDISLTIVILTLTITEGRICGFGDTPRTTGNRSSKGHGFSRAISKQNKERLQPRREEQTQATIEEGKARPVEAGASAPGNRISEEAFRPGH